MKKILLTCMFALTCINALKAIPTIYYTVHGKTLGVAQGNFENPSASCVPTLVLNYTASYADCEKEDGCSSDCFCTEGSVASATLGLYQEYRYPDWKSDPNDPWGANDGKNCPERANAWNTYINAAKAHEPKHKAISDQFKVDEANGDDVTTFKAFSEEDCAADFSKARKAFDDSLEAERDSTLTALESALRQLHADLHTTEPEAVLLAGTADNQCI